MEIPKNIKTFLEEEGFEVKKIQFGGEIKFEDGILYFFAYEDFVVVKDESFSGGRLILLSKDKDVLDHGTPFELYSTPDGKIYGLFNFHKHSFGLFDYDPEES